MEKYKASKSHQEYLAKKTEYEQKMKAKRALLEKKEHKAVAADADSKGSGDSPLAKRRKKTSEPKKPKKASAPKKKKSEPKKKSSAPKKKAPANEKKKSPKKKVSAKKKSGPKRKAQK